MEQEDLKKNDTSASLAIFNGAAHLVLKIEGLLLNAVTILNKTALTNFKIVSKLS